MGLLRAEEIIQKLGQAGYRITRPRRAVLQVVLEAEGHSSPAQVLAEARRHCPTIGLVTVYRTLELLAEMGFVRRIHTDNSCHDYVVTNRGHRHHLVCRQCGATVELDGCDLSAFLSQVSRETGYRIDDHLLELSGLCVNCQLPGRHCESDSPSGRSNLQSPEGGCFAHNDDENACNCEERYPFGAKQPPLRPQ